MKLIWTAIRRPRDVTTIGWDLIWKGVTALAAAAIAVRVWL